MLKQRLQDDMKAALKGGDKPRLAVVRLILAAIKQREVDERLELTDEQILAVLDKMVKQRRESISHFERAGRADLVEQEAFEIQVCQSYLPEALSPEELAGLIEQAVSTVGAQAIQDMGKVMGWLKPKIQGRADMGAVSTRVRQRLGA